MKLLVVNPNTTARMTALIGEQALLLYCIDPSQRNFRPGRVLPPLQRVEIAELHDPWHLREVLGELRHMAEAEKAAELASAPGEIAE